MRTLDPQAKIERHLIVPRASRVQLARHRADQFLQARLDVHVNILEFDAPRERSRLDLLEHAI
jgi:hypothetical protein